MVKPSRSTVVIRCPNHQKEGVARDFSLSRLYFSGTQHLIRQKRAFARMQLLNVERLLEIVDERLERLLV